MGIGTLLKGDIGYDCYGALGKIAIIHRIFKGGREKNMQQQTKPGLSLVLCSMRTTLHFCNSM